MATISAHSSSSSTGLLTHGAFGGLESSQEVGMLQWACKCYMVMQSCGDYIVHLPGPLRDRLLRYYAETADQVQRLLRVTANGAQQLPCCPRMAEIALPLAVLLTCLDHEPARRTRGILESCAGKFSSPHAGPEVPVTRPEALRSVVGHIRVCHLALHRCKCLCERLTLALIASSASHVCRSNLR